MKSIQSISLLTIFLVIGVLMASTIVLAQGTNPSTPAPTAPKGKVIGLTLKDVAGNGTGSTCDEAKVNALNAAAGACYSTLSSVCMAMGGTPGPKGGITVTSLYCDSSTSAQAKVTCKLKCIFGE
jgi:hypothetical protein